MEKRAAKFDLPCINCNFPCYRPYRLCSPVTGQAVIIHSHPAVTDPGKHDSTLGICKRTAPMHQIILRHRHTVIKHHLLDLCKIYRIDFTIHREALHERLYVKSPVS